MCYGVMAGDVLMIAAKHDMEVWLGDGFLPLPGTREPGHLVIAEGRQRARDGLQVACHGRNGNGH
jgi:hypothetical protein